MKTFTGIDLFKEKFPRKFYKAKAGLLTHPAGVNINLKSSIEVILNSKLVNLKAIFGPQHGFTGHTQANMIEWETFIHPTLKIPVYSLYGKERQPEKKWLLDLDLLIIDLQDVGSRYYTFIWTMAHCFKICEKIGLPVLILDRPNPIGCEKIEGYVLNEKFSSFVGIHPLPIRHSMTIAEIALYLKDKFYKNLELFIIPMKNYKRKYFFEDTNLFWVMPSPNMPSVETCFVYPGACLLEGTNISEGRGTTKPFEIFGAPYFDHKIDLKVKELKIKGAILREIYFQPTFDKYKVEICKGFQIHITDRKVFKPFKTFVLIIKLVYDLYPKYFKWKQPPYEYEYNKMPIDILAGTDDLRISIEKGKKIEEIESNWFLDCENFKKIRENYLLYK